MTDTPKPQRRQVSLSPAVNHALESFHKQVVMQRDEYIPWRAMTFSQFVDMLVMDAIAERLRDAEAR